jgi:hypothetical protein
MAGLGTSSWAAPMPESIAEVRIEYPSGLRATPACAPDTVAVAVPADAIVPPRPGCTFPDGTTATSVLDRAQQWVRSLVH